MIGEGTQIALDMYRCLETVIQDPIQIETILKECMDRFSVKALHFYLDEDPDEGSLIFTVPVRVGTSFCESAKNLVMLASIS